MAECMAGKTGQLQGRLLALEMKILRRIDDYTRRDKINNAEMEDT